MSTSFETTSVYVIRQVSTGKAIKFGSKCGWASHGRSDAPIHFTKEEVEWAIYETEYKYFGMYEFTDQQQMAVDILVWCAKERLK